MKKPETQTSLHLLNESLRKKYLSIINPTRHKATLIGARYARSPQKRLLDIAFAGVPLVFTYPITMTLAGMVRLQSKNSAFYHHSPIVPGRDHSTTITKITTMVPNAKEKEAAVLQQYGVNSLQELKEKGISNPLVSGQLGKLMRRFSLDELPQLSDVALGRINIVGPRIFTTPEWNYVTEQAAQGETWAINLLETVKNKSFNFGLTSHYFLLGRGNLSRKERSILDNHYWLNQNFTSDLKIILLTMKLLTKPNGI